MAELPLHGGRITHGVVRVGDTVRRPRTSNSPFVRRLLTHLHERGFDAVPRYLGGDEQGREAFTCLAGDVPADLDPGLSDEALGAAARLVRGLHDATAGAEIADGFEVVCHNDLSPCNFVFGDGKPVGIIDFDDAAPGVRLRDLGYALFLWLNLGTDGLAIPEQVRRIRLFCHWYGIDARREVVDAVIDAVAANIKQLGAEDRVVDAQWWQEQLDWLNSRRDQLIGLLLT